MSTQETNLKAIADAIRAKTGETGTIQASKFAEKIAEIEGGPLITMSDMQQSYYWYVGYGDGTYIAVGFPSSNDRKTTSIYRYNNANYWERVTLPVSDQWRSICYTNGKFIVLAGGDTSSNNGVYSVDGKTWTQFTLPASAKWSSIAYGGGKYVAIAGGGGTTAAYSTDGVNWTATTITYSSWWTSVTYGNGKFVAVGLNTIAYSTDGINWISVASPPSNSFQSVTYGNGKFVAVGLSTDIYYSIDGVNWQNVYYYTGGAKLAVCYGDGIFVLTGLNGILSYSSDGVNWISKPPCSDNMGVYGWCSIVYGDGEFMAVSQMRPIASCYKTAYFKK